MLSGTVLVVCKAWETRMRKTAFEGDAVSNQTHGLAFYKVEHGGDRNTQTGDYNSNDKCYDRSMSRMYIR